MPAKPCYSTHGIKAPVEVPEQGGSPRAREDDRRASLRRRSHPAENFLVRQSVEIFDGFYFHDPDRRHPGDFQSNFASD